MASQTNSYTFGYPPPPPPPSTADPHRWWWSRPIATMPPPNGRKATFKELSAYLYAPFCGGFFTVFALFLILFFVDKSHSHVKVSIQSISASPSSSAVTTWKVGVIVKNPSKTYSIYYDVDDASVKLGHLNVDVFNITRTRSDRDHTAFSLTFLVEEGRNRNDVVSQELGIKLRGEHRRYVSTDEAGYFDIRCQNLTRNHENIDKIKCHSSFTHLHMFLNRF